MVAYHVFLPCRLRGSCSERAEVPAAEGNEGQYPPILILISERDFNEYASVRCRDRCARRYNLVHVRIQGTSVLVARYRIFGHLHRCLYHCKLPGATLLGHREAVKPISVLVTPQCFISRSFVH